MKKFDWVMFWRTFLVIFGVFSFFAFMIIAVIYENAWLLFGSLLGIVSMSVALSLEG